MTRLLPPAPGHGPLAAPVLILMLAAGSAGAAEQGRLAPFSGPSGAKVLGQTVLSSDVWSTPGRETVVLTEFMTGKKGPADAVEVALDIRGPGGDQARPVATRSYLALLGGPIGGGEITLVDLDWDGTNEIVVSMHQGETTGITRIVMEILREGPDGLFLCWSGPVRINTAGEPSGTPAGERERWSREIEYSKTGASRGGMVVFKKTVQVAAGVPVQPAAVVEESFPMAHPR